MTLILGTFVVEDFEKQIFQKGFQLPVDYEKSLVLVTLVFIAVNLINHLNT